jgi:hypothetical protein
MDDQTRPGIGGLPAAAPVPAPAPLWRRARAVALALLAVYLLFFGGGYLAGKKKWVDLAALRASPVYALNRDLELRVPGYGALLQSYKNWERQHLYGYIFKGKGGKALVLVFFNNWIVSNLTMIVRAATVLPMALYPYGRFVQGLTLAQAPPTFQIWGTLVCEFGGYLLTICGTLCVLFWVLLFRRFGFATRRDAFRSGFRFFIFLFGLSGFFLLIGSYIETMYVIGMSLR